MTPSGLDRIAACPASEVFPHVRETSTHAQHGNVIHAFLDNVAKHGREEALALSPADSRILCAAIDIEALPIGGAYRSEVAFAYDYRTGAARELTVRNREYVGLGTTEIAGTADVVARLDESTVYVGDYKTGHLPPPPDSMQLRTYGLMAARAYGCSQAVCEIIQVRDDGTVWRQRAEMDAFELSIHEQQIRDVVARVEKARANHAEGKPLSVSVGAHCRYCPAYRDCPATLALARQVAAGPDELAAQVRALLTPETAAAAYERIAAVKKLVKVLDAELKDWAERHPIPTPAGKTYGPRPWSTRKVDPNLALPVLVETLGAEVADRVLPRTASVSAVEAACKEAAVARGEKAAPFIRQVMAQLEAAGAVTTETTEQIREH